MRHPVFHFFALFILFFIDFLHFSDQAAFFLLFIALFDFAVTFLLFMVLTFFSLLYLFSTPPPSSWLAFFFFCVQFYVFLIYQRFLSPLSVFLPLTAIFSSPSPLSLLLSPVFSFFSPIPYCIYLFSTVFRLFSAYFYIFCCFSPLPPLHPTFCHFFASTYVTLPGSFFTFHTFQNVSRETSFFTIFGLQRSVSSDLLFLFSKITLVFGLSVF